MTLDEFIDQERRIRPGVHLHDGIWWKTNSFGCCSPLFPLQAIEPGTRRPAFLKSFIRYHHIATAASAQKGDTNLVLQNRIMMPEAALSSYSIQSIEDRKRRQAINRSVRRGFFTRPIEELGAFRYDLFEIYVSTAKRNKHGLPPGWYQENERLWWENLQTEFSLQGRQWLGVFLEDKLVGFLYWCVVQNTALWLVTKSNADFVASDPNDLLWHEGIEACQRTLDCANIDTGWAIPIPESIDWRKRTFGFRPIPMNVYSYMNPAINRSVRFVFRVLNPLAKRIPVTTHRGLMFRYQTLRKLFDQHERI